MLFGTLEVDMNWTKNLEIFRCANGKFTHNFMWIGSVDAFSVALCSSDGSVSTGTEFNSESLFGGLQEKKIFFWKMGHGLLIIE